MLNADAIDAQLITAKMDFRPNWTDCPVRSSLEIFKHANTTYLSIQNIGNIQPAQLSVLVGESWKPNEIFHSGSYAICRSTFSSSGSRKCGAKHQVSMTVTWVCNPYTWGHCIYVCWENITRVGVFGFSIWGDMLDSSHFRPFVNPYQPTIPIIDVMYNDSIKLICFGIMNPPAQYVGHTARSWSHLLKINRHLLDTEGLGH